MCQTHLGTQILLPACMCNELKNVASRVVETVILANGVFNSLPKAGSLEEIGENSDIAFRFSTHKNKALLLRPQKSMQMTKLQVSLETGGVLFRDYCFGRENSLSSAAN